MKNNKFLLSDDFIEFMKEQEIKFRMEKYVIRLEELIHKRTRLLLTDNPDAKLVWELDRHIKHFEICILQNREDELWYHYVDFVYFDGDLCSKN